MAGGNELEMKMNMFRTIQKEIGKVHSNISTAGTQILENEMVLKVGPGPRATPRSALTGPRPRPRPRTSTDQWRASRLGRSWRCWRRTRRSSS